MVLKFVYYLCIKISSWNYRQFIFEKLDALAVMKYSLTGCIVEESKRVDSVGAEILLSLLLFLNPDAREGRETRKLLPHHRSGTIILIFIFIFIFILHLKF